MTISSGSPILTIDGSHGEGGGQILRTSLALSLVTGIPFRMVRIRARRAKPGLMRQHLTAIQAAAQVGNATVEGAYIGAGELIFKPGTVVPGSYSFAVGTAGSATLVLQTVLPVLLQARGKSTLKLAGGTHNPFAPPFDFLQRSFLPLINRMGPRVEATLEQYGFYPAGGGCFTVEIEPTAILRPIELTTQGDILHRSVRAIVARLPRSIALRELDAVRKRFAWPEESFVVEEVQHSRGPGNILFIELHSENVTEVATGFGEQGITAEQVAEHTVRAARQYLAGRAPVGCYLADQLLLPMALAGKGCFRTTALSFHALTNIDIIQKFLSLPITVEQDDSTYIVTVG
jgi:RNA 3'-terminal phosphate cyclase (ATP)